MIPVLEPMLTARAKELVNVCLDTGWISSQGKYIAEFEESFESKFGLKNCIACSNGTTAIHLALEALGIGVNDEVIVPDLTFAATINAVFHAKAYPVIADVDEATWNISIDDILKNITARTKAIIVVHLYGNPFKIKELKEKLPREDIYIIEDCAEAIGAKYGSSFVGADADAATFSFFGNKVITTGEGGMACFKNNEAYEKAKVLRDHGMNKNQRYWHDYVGFNYRMTNIQAAIGLSQLDAYEQITSLRKNVFDYYDRYLSPYKFIRQNIDAETTQCYWLYSVLLPKEDSRSVAEFQKYLKDNEVDSRPLFHPLSDMDIYRQFYKGKGERISKKLSSRGISLPSSATLSPEHLERIMSAIRDYFQ